MEEGSDHKFEYRSRDQGGAKKKRTKPDQIADDENSDWLLSKAEGNSREFKVRIVERLTYLERRLNGNG
jgi:hypothetical protein